jgi:hypothetical protein
VGRARRRARAGTSVYRARKASALASVDASHHTAVHFSRRGGGAGLPEQGDPSGSARGSVAAAGEVAGASVPRTRGNTKQVRDGGGHREEGAYRGNARRWLRAGAPSSLSVSHLITLASRLLLTHAAVLLHVSVRFDIEYAQGPARRLSCSSAQRTMEV